MSKYDDTEASFIQQNSGIDEKEASDMKNENQEESGNKKIWKRIPGFGFILIILRNILNGSADVVVKKISGIG